MANSLTIRQDASSLSDASLAALRDAWGKMEAFSGSDNRSSIHWAGFHGFPSWFCWHHYKSGPGQTQFPYDLFLPWHRAYLISLEQNLKDLNVDAAIPWWDWTSVSSHQTGVPASYADATVAGAPNPLFQAPVPDHPQRDPGPTQRKAGTPARLPTRQHVRTVLGYSDFSTFQNQLQDVHDQVHGWFRGDMGTIVFSAFDPIFYAHHCNIDRLWWQWQQLNGINNVPSSYLKLVLAPWSLTVGDVLDTHRLGYDYAVAQVTVAVGH